MMDRTTKTIVAGAGLAELPIPLSIKALRIALATLTFALVCAGAFYVSGWNWVTEAGTDGLTTSFALCCAAIVTLAAAASIALWRAHAYDRLFNLRQIHDGSLVFGGFRTMSEPALALFAVVGLAAATIACLVQSARTCPLPDQLSKIKLDILAPSSDEAMMPIYFWDYATWFKPEWLDHVNIVLPYEKGPPQKLLPKIFFEDATTHAIVLELHGKRPRHYSQRDVWDIFDSAVLQPRDWPLVWRLEREAGLTTDGLVVPTLHLMRLSQGANSNITQAVGVPWNTKGSTPRPESGRVFFWGPDGSVFQTKCPGTCELSRLLELVQFPPDPRGSAHDRLEWTKATLKKILQKTELSTAPLTLNGNMAADTHADGSRPVERRRQENLLSLYLISLLTQDPRDPEAYFHLGKLARNRETMLSALRYGKDVGMDRAQIVELESALDRL